MCLMSWFKTTPDGVVLTIRVVPRASKNEIKEVMGDALKVRLQAPPVEGKANAALVRFLAKVLSVPASSVEIMTGATGRTKRVMIHGISEQQLRYTLDH